MTELTTQQRHDLAHIENGGPCPWTSECVVDTNSPDYKIALAFYQQHKEKKIKYRFEPWVGDKASIRGTIRTVPENYYVADVRDDNTLDFRPDFHLPEGITRQSALDWWAAKMWCHALVAECEAHQASWAAQDARGGI